MEFSTTVKVLSISGEAEGAVALIETPSDIETVGIDIITAIINQDSGGWHGFLERGVWRSV